MDQEDAALMRQLRQAVGLTVGVLALGLLGYTALGWSPLDALFMTVITLSTVGYGEVRPLDAPTRLLTMILILGGVGTTAYIGATLVQYVVEGRIGGVLRHRRNRRMIAALTNHVILCGYGRVGQAVAQELRRQGVPCVVVDGRQDRTDLAAQDDLLTVCGDAAQDETLQAAGIGRARSLVSAVDSDADNIYIALTARGLAPQLHIVARASDAGAAAKLRRVGANRVLSPYSLAGYHLASLAVRSAVVDFVAEVMGAGPTTPGGHTTPALRLENVAVSSGGWLAGRSPAEVRARLGVGPTLLAVARADGQLLTDLADGQTRLMPGDLLIVIGSPAQLQTVEELA